MISPSAIKRVKYTTEQSNEFIRLQEYIIFEDDRDNEKYIVFKFRNCVSQWLHEMKFIVSEFDNLNQLIQKTTISYKDAKVKEASSFVPSAKYKCNGNTDHISVEIESAIFEKMEFNKGETKELKYDYTDLKSDKDIENIAPSKIGNSKDGYIKPTFYVNEEDKKKKKKVSIKNITTANRSYSMPVFALLTSIIILAICIFLSVYTKDYSSSFIDTSTGLIYDVNYNNGKEDGTVSVSGIYNFSGGNIQINKTVTNTANKKTYTVTSIKENAFSDNKNIKELYFASDMTIIIQANAFKNCSNLTRIDCNNSAITFKTYSFIGCDLITQANILKSTYSQFETNSFKFN